MSNQCKTVMFDVINDPSSPIENPVRCNLIPSIGDKIGWPGTLTQYRVLDRELEYDVDGDAVWAHVILKREY